MCVVKELELKMSDMFKITVEPQSLKNQAYKLFCSKTTNTTLNKISVVSRTNVSGNIIMKLV